MLTIITSATNLPFEYEENITNKPELRKKLILDKISNGAEIIMSELLIDLDWLSNIHDSEYLTFLQEAFESYKTSCDVFWGKNNELIPNHFYKTKPNSKTPIYKLSGYYGSDYMTPINKDTYENSMKSAQQAYLAADHIINDYKERVIYVAASSPGHHAKHREYGGYCFINNACCTAYHLIEHGYKTGIIDLDYHAGNGTAELVHNNPNLKDVVACSLHCDPTYDFPSFEGYGDDYNNSNVLNFPLHPHCNWKDYKPILERACNMIGRIDVLIIAFGGDTFHKDPDTSPNGRFDFQLDDYEEMGRFIKNHFNIPFIVTQEGGYDMDNISDIVDKFLQGLTSKIT